VAVGSADGSRGKDPEEKLRAATLPNDKLNLGNGDGRLLDPIVLS
jgi:hypothetical protein